MSITSNDNVVIKVKRSEAFDVSGCKRTEEGHYILPKRMHPRRHREPRDYCDPKSQALDLVNRKARDDWPCCRLQLAANFMIGMGGSVCGSAKKPSRDDARVSELDGAVLKS